MISSVSASPPLVTSPTMPRFCQLWMLKEPTLRDSPSSMASITRVQSRQGVLLQAWHIACDLQPQE